MAAIRELPLGVASRWSSSQSSLSSSKSSKSSYFTSTSSTCSSSYPASSQDSLTSSVSYTSMGSSYSVQLKHRSHDLARTLQAGAQSMMDIFNQVEESLPHSSSSGIAANDSPPYWNFDLSPMKGLKPLTPKVRRMARRFDSDGMLKPIRMASAESLHERQERARAEMSSSVLSDEVGAQSGLFFDDENDMEILGSFGGVEASPSRPLTSARPRKVTRRPAFYDKERKTLPKIRQREYNAKFEAIRALSRSSVVSLAAKFE